MFRFKLALLKFLPAYLLVFSNMHSTSFIFLLLNFTVKFPGLLVERAYAENI